MPTSLGALIRERRRSLGLTQEQLAERVGEGVRQSDISRLEQNRILLPRRERLERIAVSLDLSIGDLMVLTGWMADEHRSSLDDDVSDAADDGAQVSQEVLAAAMEALETAKSMMSETAGLLDAAERNLARVMGTTNTSASSPGLSNPHLGIIKSAESSAIFRD